MRPLKQGLDYFPFDVDFFYSDKKIKVLKAKYGCDGITLYIYLLCQIYKNGYFIKLDEDYEYIISDELKMSAEKIGQIINFLCERSLFEDKLFTSDKVLTSRGIQTRFQAAVKERGSKRTVAVDSKIWLLSSQETEAYISVTQEESLSEKNDSYSEKNKGYSLEEVHKEKKSKKEESKLKKDMSDLVAYYEANICSLSPVISEKIELWLKDVDSSLILFAMEQAVVKNKRNWSYINGIINNCYKEGKKTKSDVQNKDSKPKEYELDDMAALERKKRLERISLASRL